MGETCARIHSNTGCGKLAQRRHCMPIHLATGGMVTIGGQVRKADELLAIALSRGDRASDGHRIDVTDIGSPQRPGREGFDVGKTNVDCVAHAAAPPWTAATRVSGANALNISSTYQRTKTRVPSSISSEYGPGR